MTRKIARIQGLLGAVAVLLLLAYPAPAQETPFERSGGRATPRYAETIDWLSDLAASSTLLQMSSFGTSPQGRALPLIVADRAGRFTPAAHAGRQDEVVVLVQACIHAGESCGKDAGMALLRDLAAGTAETAGLLDRVTLLFVPIFNVDGHERFGAHNRINQNGPQEMGWRVTARNQNLNRDYLKADLPEMRAWLALFTAWRPDFFLDIHATDGADYQYPVTYAVETFGGMDPNLTTWTKRYSEAMVAAMGADGFPMAPYVSFRTWHDPASGLRATVARPRFSQGYTALQNRPGLLVETHMLKPYPVRVASARALVTHTLRWCGEQATELRKLVTTADAYAASPALRQQPFPLTFTSTGDSSLYTFLGVEYETVTSEVTGGQWIQFSDKPDTLQLPYFDTLRAELTAELPEAYLVPPEWTEAIDRLAYHGITFTRLTDPVTLPVRTWKFSNASWQERPYEGHHPVSFDSERWEETRTFPAGTAVVDLNQRAARVIAHLLEPKAPDSLVQWGYFDAIFERVEYVESYVIEQMIPDLLAANPTWAAELEAAKAANPDFAADPWAIRYWFYARTPYFDDRVGIYPVCALDSREQVEALLPR
jgi:murein tripeptide amidase MpaA